MLEKLLQGVFGQDSPTRHPDLNTGFKEPARLEDWPPARVHPAAANIHLQRRPGIRHQHFLVSEPQDAPGLSLQ